MSQEYALSDIKVYVDFAQERQNRLGPYTFATDGTQLDNSTAVNCYIEPVTLSTFGTPLPKTPEWLSSGTACTGNYYRYKKSDFTFIDPTKWKEQDVYKTGNTYIYSGSANTTDMQSVVKLNGAIGTTDAVDRNEPLYFSFRKNQIENQDDSALIKLFWSNPYNKDKDTQLHFNSDGSCDVFRGYLYLEGIVDASAGSSTVTGTGTSFLTQTNNGNEIYDQYGRLIGTISTRTNNGSLTLTGGAGNTYSGPYFRTDVAFDANSIMYSGPRKVQAYNRTESNYNQSRPVSTVINPNDKFNEILIIPCRGKELLINTSYGLNFSHSFDDLNVPDPPANNNVYNLQGINPPPNYSSQPIILPSGGFSIQVSQGKVSWQLAKLNFLQNWQITSQKIKLASAPPPLPVGLGGTISCSFGSTIVTGTGTSFNTSISAGDRLYWYQSNNDVNSILLGTVNSVVNDTSLYLNSNTIYKVDGSIYSRDQKLTGSIGFTAGNGAIQGTGTSFQSELALLDTIWDNDGNYIGLVQGIISNTNLVVANAPGFSGSGVTYWKNLNQYVNRFQNLQAEFFSSVVPENLDELELSYYITNDENNLTVIDPNALFNNDNDEFRIKIQQTNLDNADPLASGDKGYMFYSLDDVYFLKNAKTYNSNIEITSAIESLSINRSEEGAYNLNLSARKKLLEDLGMDRPLQISNRPIKVDLSPRRYLLTGTISYVGTGETLSGSGTSFLTDLYPNAPIYLNDGTFIGIATTINSDTSAGFWSYNNNTYISEPYSLYPKGSDFTLYEGYLSSPEITYLNAAFDYTDNAPNYERYALLQFTAIDKLQHLNKIYYSEAPNFDNTDLVTTFNKNIIYGGASNNSVDQQNLFADYTINTYQVPLNRNNSNGQYNFVANLGDNVGGFLEKMRSDLAQNFTFFARPDWYPNVVSQTGYSNYTSFRLMDQNYIDWSAQYYDLFLNETIAESLFGIPVYEGWKACVRSLRRTYESPEANRIFIIGLDKTNGSRIQYLKEDLDSQNPYLAPANRPTNWLGDIAPFVMINDKLNSETDVKQAGDQFYDKLTPGRNIIEFESDLITGWNPYYKYTPDNRESLSGTINVTSGGFAVTGTSTAFLSEVQVGDFLYLSNGQKIGWVRSINSDFSITLANPSYSTASGSAFYNDYTQYLNQYRYFDIGDVVGLYDEFGTVVYYRILSWDCDFIKETTTANYINARRARYRAKQIEFDPLNANPYGPEFNFANNSIPAANQWIVSVNNTLDMSFLAQSTSEYLPIIYSLTGAPAGMSIDPNSGAITWTPNSGQANKIYSFIVNAYDGTNNTEYPVSVRTYNTV